MRELFRPKRLNYLGNLIFCPSQVARLNKMKNKQRRKRGNGSCENNNMNYYDYICNTRLKFSNHASCSTHVNLFILRILYKVNRNYYYFIKLNIY